MPTSKVQQHIIEKCRENGLELSEHSLSYLPNLECPFCHRANQFMGVKFTSATGKSVNMLSQVWTWDPSVVAECKACHNKWHVFKQPDAHPKYSIENMVAYLQRNRFKFPRNILKEQLLKDGCQPEMVEDAVIKAYTPTGEALELYNGARKTWEEADRQLWGATDFCRDIASDLLLAINKAQGWYPEAYGLLSFVVSMHNTRDAKEYHTKALQQDPFQPHAWYTRVLIALTGHDNAHNVRKPGIFSDIASKNVSGAVSGAFAGLLISGVQASRQAKLKSELQEMIVVFRRMTQESRSSVLWIEFSEIIMSIGDMLLELKLQNMPNLFREIAQAPWGLITDDGYADDIARLKRKAEGRALMA